MDQVPVNGSPGAKLKELRLRLGLTLRTVEASSRKLAAEKQNPDYVISRGWLNNVENRSFTPSVYKIYWPYVGSAPRSCASKLRCAFVR